MADSELTYLLSASVSHSHVHVHVQDRDVIYHSTSPINWLSKVHCADLAHRRQILFCDRMSTCVAVSDVNAGCHATLEFGAFALQQKTDFIQRPPLFVNAAKFRVQE